MNEELPKFIPVLTETVSADVLTAASKTSPPIAVLAEGELTPTPANTDNNVATAATAAINVQASYTNEQLQQLIASMVQQEVAKQIRLLKYQIAQACQSETESG